MFVVDIKDKKPELGGITKGRKALFLAKISNGDFCVITAPENFDPDSEGSVNKLASSGLVGHIGRKTEFKDSPITNGSWIADRGFAHGPDFAFSYHGLKGSREYFLGGKNLAEILISL
jgi:hypothetical protein